MSLTTWRASTEVKLPSRTGLLRFLAALTLVIEIGTAHELWTAATKDYEIGLLTGNWVLIWFALGATSLLAVLWLAATILSPSKAWLTGLRRPPMSARPIRAGLWVIAALTFVPLSLATLHPYYGQILAARTWLKLDLIWWQSLALAACLVMLRTDFRMAGAVAAAVVAQTAFYRTVIFLPDISTYPLSLGYSEASRFYVSSLFLGPLIYGKPTALPVLHPTLHLLLAVPYLIPHSPLWAHRAWQVVLRTGLIALVGWVLARRMRIKNRVVLVVFAGWAYLFLFQGPIYLHLTVPVIILLGVFDPYRMRRSWLAVLLASTWVGISRINWFPVPGLLAAALYLLEVPVSFEAGNLFRYLRRPVLWLLAGPAIASITWRLYIAISGNDPNMFASSLTSDLLWYRLLPSPVNPLGVLPGALLVSAGPALIIALALRSMLAAQPSRRPPADEATQLDEGHMIRLVGLAGALLVLLAGGLIVSTKIGGGADLHNLDAYLVLLLIVASTLFWGRYASEAPEAQHDPRIFPWQALALAIAVPVIFGVAAQGGPFLRRDRAAADAAISELRDRIERVQDRGGEALFIDQRQLLTFGQLPGVSLAEPYEKEFLAEMVMAGNDSYLEQFRKTLRQQQYRLIIAGPIPGRQGADQPWSEENNLWLRSVGRLLECEYRALPNVGLDALEAKVYVPRPNHPNCRNR